MSPEGLEVTVQKQRNSSALPPKNTPCTQNVDLSFKHNAMVTIDQNFRRSETIKIEEN